MSCYLVSGLGGVRTDFVTAWLNSRRDFLNASWKICDNTGKTLFSRSGNPLNLTFDNFDLNQSIVSGRACFVKQPELEKSLRMLINAQEKNIALKTHLTIDVLEKIIPADLHHFFIVLNISIDSSDIGDVSKMLWEFVIKTYTCEKKDCCDDQKFCGPVGADNRVRVDVINQAFINGLRIINETRSTRATTIKIIDIDYKTLLRTNGFYHLEHLIKLDSDVHSNLLWQEMLPKSFSKTVLEKFNETWTYRDIKKSVIEYYNSLEIN